MPNPFALPTLQKLAPMTLAQQHASLFGARPFGNITPPPSDGRSIGYLGPPAGNGDSRYLGPPNQNPRPQPTPSPFGTPAAGSGTPFGSLPGAGGAAGQGRWYQPTPRQGTTQQTAFRPYQFEGDVWVNRNSKAYADANSFQPRAENQKLWDALPIQYKTDMSQWNGQYRDSWLQLKALGNQGVVFNGQQMSGDQAAEMVKQMAWNSRAQYYAAKKANQPPPALTPFRVDAGANYQVQ